MEINDLVPGTLCSFMICYIASIGPVGFIQDPNQASCIAGMTIHLTTTDERFRVKMKILIINMHLVTTSKVHIINSCFRWRNSRTHKSYFDCFCIQIDQKIYDFDVIIRSRCSLDSILLQSVVHLQPAALQSAACHCCFN